MATVVKDLGAVTAYAYAVAGGYSGTEAEFEALLGNIAEDLSEIENLSVTVTTLPAGSSATASYSNGVLSLGIPKGDKGDKGDTGATGATGPQGIPGDVANLASAYSTSSTYGVGDYCIYNSQLYRCTTAITTAEAWTAAHWTAAVLGDDVGDLKSALLQLSVPVTWDVNSTDKSIAANGSISSTSGYHYSDLLPVLPGKAVLTIKYSGSLFNVRIHGYDSYGRWLRQITYQGISGNATVSFTIPNDIKFLRISGSASTTEVTLFEYLMDIMESKANKADLETSEGLFNRWVDKLSEVVEVDQSIKRTGSALSVQNGYVNLLTGISMKAGVTYQFKFTLASAISDTTYVYIKKADGTNLIADTSFPSGQTTLTKKITPQTDLDGCYCQYYNSKSTQTTCTVEFDKKTYSDTNAISKLKSQTKNAANAEIQISLLTDFIIGEFNCTTGEINVSQKSRITALNNVTFTEPTTVRIDYDNGYRFVYYPYSSGSYSWHAWVSKSSTVLPVGTYRFMLQKDGESTPTVGDTTRTFVCDSQLRKTISTFSAEINNNNDKIDLCNDGYMPIKGAFQRGAFNNDSSYNPSTTNKYRVISTYDSLISYDRDIVVCVDPGYKVILSKYTAVGGTYLGSEPASGWYTSAKPFVISAGTNFYLEIAKDPEDQADADVNTFVSKVRVRNLLALQSDMDKVQELVDTDKVAPSYWKQHLESKIATINALNCEIGGHGDSFIFMTDYHVGSSYKKSAALIKYIETHTSITKLFYGGDTTDGGSLMTPQDAIDTIRAFEIQFRDLNMFTVRGNHDCEPTANQTINQIPDAAYYDVFLRPIEDKINTGGKLYYYVDNPSEKIRYIVMDSGGMNDPLDSTQLTWLKTKITELTSEWSVVVFQHIVGETNAEQQKIVVTSRGTSTITAINEAIQTAQCTIVALIAGHVHNDYIDTDTASYPIIWTTCDSGGANAAYDMVNPTRTAGTTTESAFDVFSINTDTRTINITRIGVGNNRQVSY